jgi:GxxExxY protein
MRHEQLTYAIIGAAIRVHNDLGPGYPETCYQNALAWELRLMRLAVERERRLRVRYRGLVVGQLVADLVVDGVVLVETKAASMLVRAHIAQVVSYLVATGMSVGLVINFGAERLEYRRKENPRTMSLRGGHGTAEEG